MSFPKFFFHFRKNYHISGKFFGIPGNFFSYLGKNRTYPENVFVCREKNFYMPFSIRKVPLKACPPQLLEASYAPGLMLSKALLRSIMTIAVNFFSSIALKICLPLPDLMSQSSGISDYHFDAESICYFVSGSCEIGQKQYSLQP
jgi:hypothetical protein